MMEIPEMTHELGKYWEQPNPDKIRFLYGNAVVSVETFKALKNYEVTNPSGVYAGKMWRREYRVKIKGSLETRHLLCWYSDTKGKEGFCDVNEAKSFGDNLTGNS